MNALLQVLLYVSIFTSTTCPPWWKPFDVYDTHDKIFRVYFEQEHKQIEARGDDVFLKKEPFDIVLEFPEPMGVLVHASLNPETFDAAVDGKPIKKLPGFANGAMTEAILNPDNEIAISNNAPAFWDFQDDDTHHFNVIEKIDGNIICKRRVVKLNDIDSNRVIKIQDVTEPLNLVFISTDADGSSTGTELNRVAIRVNWDD